jgi:hypothetical protein
MGFCQVIKANNKPCRNYAMKEKTTCCSHRGFEEKNEKNDDSKWPSYIIARTIIKEAQDEHHGLLIVGNYIKGTQNSDCKYVKRLSVLVGSEFFFKFPNFKNKTLSSAILDKLVGANYPDKKYLDKFKTIVCHQ